MRLRNKLTSLLCLCLMTLSLSGCGLQDAWEQIQYGGPVTAYEDMEYTRPDMEAIQATLDASCETIAASDSVRDILEAVYQFYDVYDSFYTNHNLADIRYCGDLTDTYWEEEYTFCLTNAPTVDAGLDELYRTAAKSSQRALLEESYFGPGFFDSYDGESWIDEKWIALLEQEVELQNQYYDILDQNLDTPYGSDAYDTSYRRPLADLFTELVGVRQEIAAYAGYDSYPEFAYDFYYYRNYTPEEAADYLNQISHQLSDCYRQVNHSGFWEMAANSCTEEETFQYVKGAAEAMGGNVQKAFRLLEKAGLYDIGYQENKYNTSYEVYLWSYGEPFIFMSPYLDQTDKLTFAHEFGHFVNEFVCEGGGAGTDISEVHSQAFEYLSLCYGSDASDLISYKMADSLCTYVEQAAYALFEQEVYELTDEDLTTDRIIALYEQIGNQFGFDSWDFEKLDYMEVPHFFTEPMYVISYVVSNDLALQFYQLEQQENGAGLTLYEKCIYSEDSYLLDFAEQYGLQSPFDENRIQEIAAFFKDLFSANSSHNTV